MYCRVTQRRGLEPAESHAAEWKRQVGVETLDHADSNPELQRICQSDGNGSRMSDSANCPLSTTLWSRFSAGGRGQRASGIRPISSFPVPEPPGAMPVEPVRTVRVKSRMLPRSVTVRCSSAWRSMPNSGHPAGSAVRRRNPQATVAAVCGYGARVHGMSLVGDHAGTGCAAKCWSGLGRHGVHIPLYPFAWKQVALGFRRDDVQERMLDGRRRPDRQHRKEHCEHGLFCS